MLRLTKKYDVGLLGWKKKKKEKILTRITSIGFGDEKSHIANF